MADVSEPHPLPIVVDLLREHGMDAAAEQLLATCATCRFWGKKRLQKEHDLKRCSAIVSRKSLQMTPIAQLTRGRASVYTPPDFSCRLWEKIPKEKAP